MNKLVKLIILSTMCGVVNAKTKCPLLQDVTNIYFYVQVSGVQPTIDGYRVSGQLTSENQSWVFESYIKKSSSNEAEKLVRAILNNREFMLANDPYHICHYTWVTQPWGEVTMTLQSHY